MGPRIQEIWPATYYAAEKAPSSLDAQGGMGGRQPGDGDPER